jgi:nitrite reductase/ring-hydroxylating ferredoxin subunit
MNHEWDEKAVNWYNKIYNFREKTLPELKKLRREQEILSKEMPTEYRTGVHLIGKECAFMGEDIYVVDGDIQHTIHVECSCKRSGYLFRNGKFCCPICK